MRACVKAVAVSFGGYAVFAAIIAIALMMVPHQAETHIAPMPVHLGAPAHQPPPLPCTWVPVEIGETTFMECLR